MQTVPSDPALTDAGKGSVTVTAASQFAVLPLASVTVIVTVETPRSAQVKADLLSVTEDTEQLSVGGPARTLAGTMVALPEASRVTVALMHETAGDSVSFTVTVKEQVEIIPSASVEV